MITTRGWDNVYVPDKVFVEQLQPINGVPNYEYSEEKPPQLAHRIDDLLNGYYSTHNYLQLFYCLPEIFAPVHEIAKRVSDATWQLRKFNSDEVVYNDAEFNRLFSKPNPMNTMRQLVYMAVCYEIMTGKQLFYKNQPSTLALNGLANVSSWSNLPSPYIYADNKRNVDPYTATSLNDFVNNFYEQKIDGKRRIFDTKDVLPVINFSLEHPFDINCAVPLIKGADKAIRNLIPVYEARGHIYIKRGALGLWVSTKTEDGGKASLSPAEKKDAEDELNNMYGITGNRNMVGVARAPLDFVKSNATIAELQPFEETLADALAIYSVLGVPRHYAPNKNNTNYDNASVDEKNFYQNLCAPWAQRYADLWTDWFGLSTSKNYRQYIFADFSHITILQENKKDKVAVDKTQGDIMLQRFLNGVCSLNDWLVAIGEKDVDLPLYNKKLLEMDETELQAVKNVINMKGAITDPNKQQQNKNIEN